MEAPVPSLSPSWETLMNLAPPLDAAMAKCGALPPRVTMMTANGVSVLIKVKEFASGIWGYFSQEPVDWKTLNLSFSFFSFFLLWKDNRYLFKLTCF